MVASGAGGTTCSIRLLALTCVQVDFAKGMFPPISDELFVSTSEVITFQGKTVSSKVSKMQCISRSLTLREMASSSPASQY